MQMREYSYHGWPRHPGVDHSGTDRRIDVGVRGRSGRGAIEETEQGRLTVSWRIQRISRAKADEHPPNLAEVIDRLGGIAISRVRVDPPIGRATEKDLMVAKDPFAKLLELMDGVLVEKAATAFGSVIG